MKWRVELGTSSAPSSRAGRECSTSGLPRPPARALPPRPPPKSTDCPSVGTANITGTFPVRVLPRYSSPAAAAPQPEPPPPAPPPLRPPPLSPCPTYRPHPPPTPIPPTPMPRGRKVSRSSTSVAPRSVLSTALFPARATSPSRSWRRPSPFPPRRSGRGTDSPNHRPTSHLSPNVDLIAARSLRR